MRTMVETKIDQLKYYTRISTLFEPIVLPNETNNQRKKSTMVMLSKISTVSIQKHLMYFISSLRFPLVS